MIPAALVLTIAKNRIESGWSQGACARDANGNEVDIFAPEAVSFCAVAALRLSTNDRPGRRPYLAKYKAQDLLAASARLVGYKYARDIHVDKLNDVATKEEMLKVFDLAIEAAS